MRDPNRIPRLLSKLEVIWLSNPDWRLGQLIEIVYESVHGTQDNTACIFNVEDDEAEEHLNNALSTYGSRI